MLGAKSWEQEKKKLKFLWDIFLNFERQHKRGR